MRYLLTSLLLVLSFSLQAIADEQISLYYVKIAVDPQGDIEVTEDITVQVEGRQIRRGIFRDLPRYYQDDATGGRLPFQYSVLSVERNGQKEPYSQGEAGNAWRLRIGDGDILLPTGQHVYRVRYKVKNQIRYFDTHDELYWNVTGTYWAFAIEHAEAVITFPEGAQITQAQAFTGARGTRGRQYAYRRVQDAHVFETTAPLRAGEGLTVVISLTKGAIAPPSSGDQIGLWWARHGAISVLIVSFLALLGFYYRSFNRVGRDPVKGPVFPHYEAPAGYSPAAAHHIYYRGIRGHGALIASLMQLGVTGFLKIAVEKKTFFGQDRTSLTLLDTPGPQTDLPDDTRLLVSDLFSLQANIELDGKPNQGFIKNYNRFKDRISHQYGTNYFRWNFGYLVVGGLLTLAAVIYAADIASLWTGWHSAAIGGLIALNLIFMYLMPAPSRHGQDIRTHLEGFRLYMETAESLHLNSAEIGSPAPPPMTKERYETFLPYAIALGVERPWSSHFQTLVPEDAAAYNPGWSNLNALRYGSIGRLTDSVVSGISSGVSSAAPQSSGSSGGGGFSGGGGGGGGGGGW